MENFSLFLQHLPQHIQMNNFSNKSSDIILPFYPITKINIHIITGISHNTFIYYKGNWYNNTKESKDDHNSFLSHDNISVNDIITILSQIIQEHKTKLSIYLTFKESFDWDIETTEYIMNHKENFKIISNLPFVYNGVEFECEINL
jgi:hypothetical protein